MRMWNLNQTFRGDNAPRGTTWIYCGVSLFRDACYQLISGFLLTYIALSGVLSSNEAEYMAQFGVISAITIICLIWDGFNDPIMGWLIEKVKFKWGKYKPWILIGGLANTVVVLVLFLARPTGWGFVVLFSIFYFLFDIVWTINDIAYWSMLPSLSNSDKKRNQITSIMQIFISVGVFGVYGAVPMLVGAFENVSAQDVYGIIAVIITTLYLISQLFLVFGCKERSRDDYIDKPEDVKFTDMFKLLVKNKQVRVNIFAILLNYLGAGVVVAFGMYYFYLMFGYGSANGGDKQFLFTIMYAIGTLIAQFSYPLLSKFLKRKHILMVSLATIAIGYLLFFFMGIPVFSNQSLVVANPNLMFLLYLSGVIFFFGQGLHAITIIIQMQSTIDYNEYKFGERKEALVSSMRALVAKIGSAIQRLLVTGTLFIAGLTGIMTTISNAEALIKKGFMTYEQVHQDIEAARLAITQQEWLLFSIGMIWIPLVLLITSILICRFVFKIDENKYEEISSELKKRKENLNQ